MVLEKQNCCDSALELDRTQAMELAKSMDCYFLVIKKNIKCFRVFFLPYLLLRRDVEAVTLMGQFLILTYSYSGDSLSQL